MYGCLRARAEPLTSTDPLGPGRGVPMLVDDWEWRGVEVGVGEGDSFRWVAVETGGGQLIHDLSRTRFASWGFCRSARGPLLDAVDAARTDHAERISRWYEETGIVGMERTPELDGVVEEFLDAASAGLRGVPDPESVARRWTTFVVRHASLGADRVLPRLAELQAMFVERASSGG